jgi:hypothetical protein
VVARHAAQFVLVAVTGATLIAQDTATRDAASMKAKLAAIAERGAAPKAGRTRPAGSTTTRFSDREVNAYFKIHGPEFLPPGLESPQITIGEGGRVSARATVDLDVALKTGERSLFNPLSWLSGKTEIVAAGVLRGVEGQGTLQVATATLGGVPVPVTVLQELVYYYTRTPENPQGLDLSKPFELPSGIRSIETRTGEATIIQF